MNFKMVIIASVAALVMGACAHKSHSGAACGCGTHKEEKKQCAGGECALDKKCADCQTPAAK